MCISRLLLAFGVKFSGNNTDQFKAVHILGVLLCLVLFFVLFQMGKDRMP